MFQRFKIYAWNMHIWYTGYILPIKKLCTCIIYILWRRIAINALAINALANRSLMFTKINQTLSFKHLYFSSLNFSGGKFRSTRFECHLKRKILKYIDIYILLLDINHAPPPPPPMMQITTYQKFLIFLKHCENVITIF